MSHAPHTPSPAWRRPALPLRENAIAAEETTNLQAVYAVLPSGSVLSEAVFRELVGRRESTDVEPEAFDTLGEAV